jgi:hypothetical protein
VDKQKSLATVLRLDGEWIRWSQMSVEELLIAFWDV